MMMETVVTTMLQRLLFLFSLLCYVAADYYDSGDSYVQNFVIGIGAIIGIIAAVIAGVVIFIVVCVCCCCNKRRSGGMVYNRTPNTNTTTVITTATTQQRQPQAPAQYPPPAGYPSPTGYPVSHPPPAGYHPAQGATPVNYQQQAPMAFPQQNIPMNYPPPSQGNYPPQQMTYQGMPDPAYNKAEPSAPPPPLGMVQPPPYCEKP